MQPGGRERRGSVSVEMKRRLALAASRFRRWRVSMCHHNTAAILPHLLSCQKGARRWHTKRAPTAAMKHKHDRRDRMRASLRDDSTAFASSSSKARAQTSS
eukprot:11628-Heterococcus_DN1.PRE.1